MTDTTNENHGWKWEFGIRKVARPNPYPTRGRVILLCVLGAVAVVITWLAFPAHHATPVNTARVTAIPSSAPTVATVPVSGTSGVCILPTLAKVKVVKVP
jgi:hypothetical protein